MSVTDPIVYRMFDAEGTLLYVGHSMRGIERAEEHSGKPWFDQVTRIEIERFADVSEAVVGEAKAILMEKPTINSQHPAVMSRLRRLLFEIDVIDETVAEEQESAA